MVDCTFKLFSRSVSGTLIELDCYEKPLFLGTHDFLVVQLDRQLYPFQLLANPLRWIWPKQDQEFPGLILGILNAALKMGKVEPLDSVGGSITYVLQGYTKISGIGLCPCLVSRFDRFEPGQMLQLWTGEIMIISSDGSLRHHRDSWTPGKDHTPPQRSRIWEEE